MANWWELTEVELANDPDALEARSTAYFNTFYGTDDGRAVLVDLGKLSYERKESAAATLAGIELYHAIKARAGLTVDCEKAAIDAEGSSI